MNNRFRKILLSTLGVSLLAALGLVVKAQPAPPDHAPLPALTALPPAPVYGVKGGSTLERSIAVDKAVNLNLCVTEGNLKINGWNRGEVRVMVKEGSPFGFKVQLKSTSGLPALLTLYGAAPKNKPSMSDCIWGSEIEIDAPVGSTVNVKGREIQTVIDSVRKVSIYAVGGNIILRNIPEGVSASTNQGDVTVEESAGPMMLDTTTGNIIAFDVAPHEIGDMFKAKTTNGNLSLQQVGFRQVEVNSISGSVLYAGDLTDGASYNLRTSNGSIRLQIPQNTNCQMNAIYASGNFATEIPFKVVTENIREGDVKSVVGKFGTGGDTTVKLTTNNGSISIKKL